MDGIRSRGAGHERLRAAQDVKGGVQDAVRRPVLGTRAIAWRAGTAVDIVVRKHASTRCYLAPKNESPRRGVELPLILCECAD